MRIIFGLAAVCLAIFGLILVITVASGKDSAAWVLGTIGVAVLAGGVWAVSRMRRESL